MQYGYGRRFGFRGSSLSTSFVGRGRGGLPRFWHPSLWGTASYPQTFPYWPVPTNTEELEFLKNQAEIMKNQLGDIESRIKELGKIKDE